MKNIENSFKESIEVLTGFVGNLENIKKTSQASRLISATFKKNGKVLICGNGGSLCDSMHFAQEFSGRFRKDRKALPALSLLDPSHITCVGNDYGFDEIFARAVEAYGRKEDILIAISTSGNSSNVIKAVRKARENGMKIICFLGKDGGDLKGLADIEFLVAANTTDKIQEVHMTTLHIIIEEVEGILF